VAIFAIIWISVLYATQGLQAVVVPCLMFWTLLWSIGMLNDGKRNAIRFEMFRLFLVMPAGLYGLLQSVGSEWPPQTAWTVLAIYVLFSTALLKPTNATITT
jgi:hypothetical protein